MNIRHTFQERTKKLLDHFSSCLMPKDGVAVQLMNDFPVWTPDELAFVAMHCGIQNAILERMYLKSYRLFREVRLQEQKPLHGRAKAVDGAIREIEGQEWERPKKEQAKQQMGGNHFGGVDIDTILEEMRKAGLDNPGHGRSFDDFVREFQSSSRRGGKTSAQSQKEAQDAARRARQGAGSYTDTSGTQATKPWSAAPGYLHVHLAILELGWPVSRDDAKAKHREMAKKSHPDVGGSTAAFQKVQLAWETLDNYYAMHPT
jgi:hypothetical protein